MCLSFLTYKIGVHIDTVSKNKKEAIDIPAMLTGVSNPIEHLKVKVEETLREIKTKIWKIEAVKRDDKTESLDR